MSLRCLSCRCGEKYYLPYRFFVAFMTFMGIVVDYSMRTCLNLAITQMVLRGSKPAEQVARSEESCPEQFINTTIIIGGPKYEWSEKDQGLILGAFFPGYVITHVPGGILSDVFGGKHALATGVLISIMCTFLSPVSIEIGGIWFLIVLRFIMGIAQGPMFPSVSTLLAKWIPAKERSTVGSLVYTGAQIGTITGNLITAEAMTLVGTWPFVYYFWGILSCVWYIVFLIFCTSEPADHPFITETEAAYLNETIGGPVRRPKIPWKAILSSVPVWGLILGEIGHDLLYFMVVTNLPKYMSDVLKYNIQQAGLMMALPFIVLWFTGFISGFSADFLIARRMVSVLSIRKWYSFIGCVGPALCCLAVPYMGCNRMWASAMIVIGMGTMGPYYPGLRVNGIDLSTNFAGIIMAVVNGAGALSFFPVPYWIGHVTVNHTVAEWKVVFWVLSMACIGFTIFYLFMAKADRQKWDYVETTTTDR